ncbi:MAG: hypothetical protein ACTSRS_00615 [Candidatus Helarchaeota archaeon]
MPIRTSTPNSLVLAGEGAMHKSMGSGIALAFHPRLNCEVAPSDTDYLEFSFPELSIYELKATIQKHELIFDGKLSKELASIINPYKFIIETSLFFLDTSKPFKLKLEFENFPFTDPIIFQELKSRSLPAAIVSIHAAIWTFFDKIPTLPTQKERLFKLCLLTQFIMQDRIASGIEIACSFYGGGIHYIPFPSEWMISHLEKNSPFEILLNSNWPNLKVTQFPPIKNLFLLLGIIPSFQSSSQSFDSFKKSSPSIFPIHEQLITELTKLITDLCEAWRKQDQKRVLSDIKIADIYYRRLRTLTNSSFLTPEVETLCIIANELQGAGKVSRPNQGIALCFKRDTSTKILEEWSKHGIVGINLPLDYKGLEIKL